MSPFVASTVFRSMRLPREHALALHRPSEDGSFGSAGLYFKTQITGITRAPFGRSSTRIRRNTPLCISAFTSFWQASIHACFVLPSGIRMIAFQLDGVFVISSPTMVIACIVSLPAGYHALASRLTLLTEPVSMSRTSVRPARSAVPCRMTSASVHFFRLLRS